MPIGRRVPHLVIQAVENAMHVEVPVTQERVQAAAAFPRQDLPSVGQG